MRDQPSEDLCEICQGTGEVIVNGTDEQGRITRGTDTEKCECQIREPEDFSGASEGDR